MTIEDKNQTGVGQDALEKALTKLSELAKSEKDEKADLLSKAQSSDLSTEENARLMTLLGGGDKGQDTLAKSATAGLQPASNPAIEQAVDVSEFLKSFHAGSVGALEALADVLEKSDARQSEFNIILAKALVQTAALVKSMDTKLEAWAGQTVERPKAANTPAQAAQALTKSIAGNTSQENSLSKPQILDILEAMHVESLKKGLGGQATCGEDLQKSIAKYEQTGRMTRELVEEVKAYRTKRAA